MTESENNSHPLFLCEPGLPCLTVRTLFNNKTPCFAKYSKFPDFGTSFPISFFISLNIFNNEGGILISFDTLNDKPWA